MNYFCPNCYAEIQRETIFCPVCLFRISQWNDLNYDQKLIMAIRHKETFTRMRAVFLLGERKTNAAIEPLKAAFLASTDPYFKSEILQALWKIDRIQFDTFIEKMEIYKESAIVRNIIEQVNKDEHVFRR